MSRKAGSDKFKKELSQAERNRRARERSVKDRAYADERLEGVKGIEGLDRDLVLLAFQGDKFGEEDRARYDALFRLKKKKSKRPRPEPKPEPQPKPTPKPEPVQGVRDVKSSGKSLASPIYQANPIGIKGDNNQVNQDNSITQNIDNRDQSDNRRFYGGNTRIFSYKGGKGESSLYDTPVSLATMGGFYDTDDSPSAAAKFIDQYIDSNLLGQKDMRRAYDDRKNTDYSANNPGRMAELENRLSRSISDSRQRSAARTNRFFGENSDFNTKFKFPEPAAPITSDADKIYEDALKQIKGKKDKKD